MIDYSPNRLVSTCCMSFFYQACHRQPYNPHLSAFESLYKTDPTYFRGLRNISTIQKLQDCPIKFQFQIILALVVSGVTRGPGIESSVVFPWPSITVVHNCSSSNSGIYG